MKGAGPNRGRGVSKSFASLISVFTVHYEKETFGCSSLSTPAFMHYMYMTNNVLTQLGDRKKKSVADVGVKALKQYIKLWL